MWRCRREKPSGKATGHQTRTAHGASVAGRRAPPTLHKKKSTTPLLGTNSSVVIDLEEQAIVDVIFPATFNYFNAFFLGNW